jgi:ABC-type transport system involved in multi-copper enzyme maturation permease subunit
MIWLTWRQFRLQALVIAAAVLVIGFALLLTGPDLLHSYQVNKTDFLNQIEFQQWNKRLYVVGIVAMYGAPPVIGAFWGAPLVARELEAGTHRLVWNQSVSPTRWLLTKLAISGGSAVVIVGLLSWAVTRWSDPIDDAVGSGAGTNSFMPRIWPTPFGARGIVPIGYTAFAFVLGVAIGIVVRRSLVAVALTLALVIAVLILSPMLLRPHLVSPSTALITATRENMRGLELRDNGSSPRVTGLEVEAGAPGDWKLSDKTVNSAGQVQAFLPDFMLECGPPPPDVTDTAPRPSIETCLSRLADEGYRQRIEYIPASKFWDLQWRETGIYAGLALLLVGFSFWRIKRDLT